MLIFRWVVGFLEKKPTKISHTTKREIVIWQIQSSFAFRGAPCLDITGNGSSVIGDLESFFKGSFFHINKKKKLAQKYLIIFCKMDILFAIILTALTQLSEFKFLTSKWNLQRRKDVIYPLPQFST